MGLDMYFIMKRPDLSGDVLMCMNGAFPVGFQSEGKQIGYMRKAHSVNDFLVELLEVDYEDINCKDIELNDIHIKHIMEEIEYRFDNNYFIDDWDEDDWRDFKEIMLKIKELSKDPDAHFFYTIWY